MDALHKLISFQAGAAAAIPNIVMLSITTIVLGRLAVRRFRYEGVSNLGQCDRTTRK